MTTHHAPQFKHPDDMAWQLGRFRNATKFLFHPTPEHPNTPNAGFLRYEPGAGFPFHKDAAVNVQVKAEIRRAGAAADEPSDLPRVVQILREANYQGWVALEYEAKEDPWKAIPPLLTRLRELTGAPSAAAPVAEWRSLFDGKSLAGWKPTKFSGQGEVLVENGRIILGEGNDLTGLNLDGEIPKTNYEVALEATRIQEILDALDEEDENNPLVPLLQQLRFCSERKIMIQMKTFYERPSNRLTIWIRLERGISHEQAEKLMNYEQIATNF